MATTTTITTDSTRDRREHAARRARALCLRYNAVFLPEYVSTVIISVIISLLCLVAAPLGQKLPGQRVHAVTAAGLYTAMSGWLLFVTWSHRMRYGTVMLSHVAEDRPGVRSSQGVVPFDMVSRVEEDLEGFFGRAIRVLRIHDRLGCTLSVNEGLVGYDHLRRVFASLCETGVEVTPNVRPEHMDAAKRHWDELHDVLPAPAGIIDFIARCGWRTICLIPVAFGDLMLNLALIGALLRAQQPVLLYYAAPFSLLISAILARFVYYYLLTSVVMNRRVGG